MDYFEFVKPTYIENWPAALSRLTMAQQDVPLSLEEARALGSNIAELGESFGPTQSIAGIRHRVREVLAHFPRGALLRLGSRSPKDSWTWFDEGPRVTLQDADPLRHFLSVSERTADDLLLALQHDYPPHLWVRQWLEIPPWAEWRCFQRGRELVGVSQYNYRQHYPECVEHQEVVRWAIDLFHEQQFRQACPLPDVVFDVFVKLRHRHDTGFAKETAAEVTLIEINPWSPRTDPCLFTWKDGDFDGGTRIVEA